MLSEKVFKVKRMSHINDGYILFMFGFFFTFFH